MKFLGCKINNVWPISDKIETVFLRQLHSHWMKSLESKDENDICHILLQYCVFCPPKIILPLIL